MTRLLKKYHFSSIKMPICSTIYFQISVLSFLVFFSSLLYAQNEITAVLPFKDTSIGDKYKKFIDGLPDMLMTDLGKSKTIEIVERLQVDKALKNFEIESIGIVNEETAIKIGQWIGATSIIIGNFTNIDDMVRIDTRIISVKTGKIIASAKVEGNENQLFKLVDELATKILDNFTGEGIVHKYTKGIFYKKTFSVGYDDWANKYSNNYSTIEYIRDIDDPSIEFILESKYKKKYDHRKLPVTFTVRIKPMKNGRLDTLADEFVVDIHSVTKIGFKKFIRTDRNNYSYFYYFELISINTIETLPGNMFTDYEIEHLEFEVKIEKM